MLNRLMPKSLCACLALKGRLSPTGYSPQRKRALAPKNADALFGGYSRVARHILIALALTTYVSLSLHAQSTPLFHFEPKPGPYTVGLKVVEQYDHSRVFRSATDALGKPYTGDRDRPLQTLIWYPATASTAKTMTVKDYVDLLPTETEFDHPQVWAYWKDYVAALKLALASPMTAVRDAQPTIGHFPVVIYSPSLNGMSWQNADLCEYLASYGYVVIATPDLGAKTRAIDVNDRNVDAEADAGDIEFLIAYAHTLPDADMSKISVAGYSWGGMANLYAAAKDSRILAMAELDTSFRYYPGLVKDTGYVHPNHMTIPMLYLSHGEDSEEIVARRNMPSELGPSVLNAWTHGDLIYVNMMGLVHGEFSSMAQRNETFWKNYPNGRIADYSREDGTVGYAYVARYVLAFLDSYLKGGATGTTFLKNTPAENGAPPHSISVLYRKAKGLAPTLETLKLEAGKQGFNHLDVIYAAMKKDTPDFKPIATEMGVWADDLIASGHLPEAIDVLKLNTEIYPDGVVGFQVYTALADAYSQNGQKDLAIVTYKTQLEKTPGNALVIEKLKALSK
jgi:dienelactone hydrolase